MKPQRMTLCALFAALTAMCAQVSLPIGPVPINLGLLPLLTCAALLPPRYAASTALLYIAMGAIGLPVFAGMSGGPGVLVGPTGGYLLGYVVCTALSSALIQRQLHPLAATALGIGICYLLGTLWLMHATSLTLLQALLTGTLPFIPGDAAKALVAYRLALRLRKVYPGLGRLHRRGNG